MKPLIRALVLMLSLSTMACGQLEIEEQANSISVQSSDQKVDGTTSLNGTSDFCNFRGCTLSLEVGCKGPKEAMCAAKSVDDVMRTIPNLGYDPSYVTKTLLCNTSTLIKNRTWKIDASTSFQALHIYFSEKDGVLGFGTEVDYWQQSCGYSYFYGTVPKEACGSCPQP